MGVSAITQRIFRVMGRRGISKAELARRAGFDASYLTRLEKGSIHEPSPGRLLEIATALGVESADLIEAPAPPAGVPDDLLAELRDLVSADADLWREIAAELRRRPPEERADAARWALDGLRLLRGATGREN